MKRKDNDYYENEKERNERVVVLKEWKPKIVTLNEKQVNAIRQIEKKFIEITHHKVKTKNKQKKKKILTEKKKKDNQYKIISKNTVGVFEIEGKKFIIQPKIEIKCILFLMSFGSTLDFEKIVNLKEFKDDSTNMDDFIEMVIHTFLDKLALALKNGTLQNYKTVNERLETIRGKIDFNKQIGFHFFFYNFFFLFL